MTKIISCKITMNLEFEEKDDDENEYDVPSEIPQSAIDAAIKELDESQYNNDYFLISIQDNCNKAYLKSVSFSK